MYNIFAIPIYIDITIQLSCDCMEHEKTIKREE